MTHENGQVSRRLILVLGGSTLAAELVGCSEDPAGDGGVRPDAGRDASPADAADAADADVVEDADVIEDADAASPASDYGARTLVYETVDTSLVRYVSTTGNDTSDGLTPGTAWRNIATAASRATPGMTVYVKAGTYAHEQLSFPTNGTANAPIRIVGYQITPGDNPTRSDFSHLTPVDAGMMPLLAGSDRATGTAINFGASQHVYVTNMQVSNYQIGAYAAGASSCLARHLYMRDLGDRNADYDGLGIKWSTGSQDCVADGCVVVNAGSEGIMLEGNYNSALNCKVYCDDNSTGVKSATDYYFHSGGLRNKFSGSFAHRVGKLGHLGHGFMAKTTGRETLFEYNEAVNFDGESFGARYPACVGNVFRFNISRGGNGLGFILADNASGNLFEDNQVIDGYRGFSLFDSGQDGTASGPVGSAGANIIRRMKMTNLRHSAITLSDYIYADTVATGLRFEDLVVDGSPRMFDVLHRAVDFKFDHAQIVNVLKYATFGPGKTLAADLDVKWSNSTFTGSESPPPGHIA